MQTAFQAIGLVLVVEGLVFALAPGRIEEALLLLARLPNEWRRILGLGALAAGVLVLTLVRVLGH
ncbi:DUF2065 family protein [Acidimangrovimonas pyrenivorans]|uniref:DUF2065 family protein n=1 Tax=Acidimangrovimonas pyrenivorans TaxID=2030798 RepID=A0ABV7ACW9_9RHOB